MKAKHILIGCTLLAFSATVTAEADKTDISYVGGVYTMLTVSPEGLPDFDLSALGVRGGHYINKYFSVEGRLAFGVGDDSLSVIGDLGLGFGPETLTLAFDLDYSLGVYAVGHIPLTEQFQLYGLVGLTKQEITLEACAASIGCDSDGIGDSDLSFGVGAEFDVTRNLSLGLEYISYLTDGDIYGVKYDTDGIGLTVNYLF